MTCGGVYNALHTPSPVRTIKLVWLALILTKTPHDLVRALTTDFCVGMRVALILLSCVVLAKL
jgi:hypothetical protein